VTRKTVLAGLLGAFGLAVYLWPAVAAPVVLWSDSRQDLDWARRGIGTFQPAPRGDHPAKPAYLLFLRGATALPVAASQARRAVLVQSLLLWAAIAGTSLVFARKRGAGAGAVLYVILILFLRLRDSASAVMSEAFSAALFLPLAACVLWPPRRALGLFLSGLGSAALFWARPNLGGVALALILLRLAATRRGGAALALLAIFIVFGLPVWLATRPPGKGDPLGGVSYPLLEATADYYWRPSIEPWPRGGTPHDQMLAEMRRAAANWKAKLDARGADARRELVWRVLHGIFGTDYYDARWSPFYASATMFSRILSPALIVAAIACLLPFFAGTETGAGLAGLLLLFFLALQDVILGSNPRYVLPALPALLLFGAAAVSSSNRESGLRKLAACVLFVALTAGLWAARFALDWQWGKVEAPGVKLVQPIPKGALPPRPPATLHLRIAPPLVPTAAGLDILGPGNRLLYSSRDDPARQRPFVTIPLPDWLLEANRRGPVELSLLSSGGYDPTSYLLFPVIPPPWAQTARRDGSPALSPVTGIRSGSLDWWAHPGSAD
jgi:hypothetical protein